MRVAVCISGTCTSSNPLTDLKRNNKRIKEKFMGCDFYYGTYESYKNVFETNFPDDQCFYFKEPEINYHPYIDVPKDAHVSHHFTERVRWAKSLSPEKKKWTTHHTKQILVHSWLVDQIDQDYDVIVRARFDGFVHKKANWMPYIQDAYENGTVHGFAVTRQNMFDQFYDSPMEKGHKHEVYMLDQLIIHRRDRLDTSMVYNLHEERKLHAAEFGWYQVLSHPWGGIHKNHHGFINHDKNILDQYLMDLK